LKRVGTWEVGSVEWKVQSVEWPGRLGDLERKSEPR
jgi:hypothetical protein